jgi:hypothetical protein
MVGHTLCGCSNMSGIMEGLENIDSSDTTKKIKDKLKEKTK